MSNRNKNSGREKAAKSNRRKAGIQVCKSRSKAMGTHSSQRLPRLSEAQIVVLVKASQNEDAALISSEHRNAIGGGISQRAFGSSANDQRCIEALYCKGLLEGDRDVLGSLQLTALAFQSLHIDRSEWPQRLREEAEEPVATNTTEVKSCGSKDSAEGADTEPNALRANKQLGDGIPTLRPGSKGAHVLALLSRSQGATLNELQRAVGWQAHSVRGFLSGTVRKKLGYAIVTEQPEDGPRVWRIESAAQVSA